MKEIALRTSKLTKKYGKFTALDNVDMTVYRGDIYGLIGRNGAGKTTIMKSVTGLTNPTSGEYEIFSKKGREVEPERKRIGCLIEEPAFFPNMTGYENLKYYCMQKGVTNLSQIDEGLALVQLTEAQNKKFKTYSLGMKQRLGIALAILDNPDLIILDEPINGLDPIGISELRNTFHKLNKERGLTIVISSHILSELYAVANRFLFIDKGRVIKEITKEELEAQCTRCIVVKADDIKRGVMLIEDKLDVEYKVIDGKEIRIYKEGLESAKLNRMLVEGGVEVSEIYESGINIEDYFKTLVGEI